MLDPDIRRLLDTVFNVADAGGPPDVALLRAAVEQAPGLLGGAPQHVASVVDMLVPAEPKPVPVRVYKPQTALALPLLLYAHGGGWVTGSLDSHDRLCRDLAHRLPAIVVAVDYRRAPEDLYPAALDDFEAAWRWLGAQAAHLGGDATCIAVAGDSSGGNLAAALALRLRAHHALQPRLQLLLYPALDASCSRDSYREFATGFNLTGEQMAWYWNTYRGTASVDAPELSPLACADASGLAPAVVAVATCDVLRDDGIAYAERLRAAGVPAQLIRCEGMIHGFLRWTGAVPAASHWIDGIAEAVRATFERCP